MTTDNQNRGSELWKKLRQGMEKLKPAAEDDAFAAAEASPEEPDAPPDAAPAAEGKEAEARASENDIISALRRFSWVLEEPPAEAAQEPAESPEPDTAGDGLPEGEPEETAAAQPAPEPPPEQAAEKTPEELPETETGAGPEPAVWPETEAAAPPEQGGEALSAEPEASGEDLSAPLDLDKFLAEVKAEVADAEDTDIPEEELLPRREPVTEASLSAGAEGEAEASPEKSEETPEQTGEGAEPEEEHKIGFDLDALLRAVELLAQDPGREDGAEEGEGEEAKVWEPGEGRGGDGGASEALEDDETHVFSRDDMETLHREEGEEPEEDEEEEDLEPAYTARDFRPIRRRRNYRTGLMGGIRYFLFVLCVSAALACFAWLAADDVLSLNKEYKEADVYVGEDMRLSQVATELHSKGLIRYRRLFTVFAKLFHAEEKIQPGTYTLSTKLDYRALIQNMHHYTGWTGDPVETVKVTIPEGKTVMETFQILAEHGVCPYETLMECAAEETFEYAFLKDIPDVKEASRLEGYLFPDTYEFYADSSPKVAICKFLDNFQVRFSDRLMEQAEQSGYSLHQILTVASLIEMEAGNDDERGKIASVIYNRLQSTSYPYLQIDATIQYAMGERKESLTYADLEIDSPYNTYKYPGLPPGPIANCGLASIRAALTPESTGYYFYALNKKGGHEFFSTYSAFQNFVNSSNFGG